MYKRQPSCALLLLADWQPGPLQLMQMNTLIKYGTENDNEPSSDYITLALSVGK